MNNRGLRRINDFVIDSVLHSVVFELQREANLGRDEFNNAFEYPENAPDGYEIFDLDNGINKTRCIFCKEKHHNYTSLTIANHTEVGVCKGCAFMLDQKHIMYSAAARKIGNYLLHGLEPVITTSIPDNRCAFCNTKFHAESEYKGDDNYLRFRSDDEIWLPQGKQNIIIRSYPLCTGCGDMYVSLDKFLEQHYADYKAIKNIAHDVCANTKCGKSYEVHLEEASVREINNTLGQHVCDECLIKTGHVLQDRIRTRICKECSSVQELDISHISNFPTPAILPEICDNCISRRTGSAFTYLIQSLKPLDIRVLVVHSMNKWWYQILEFNESKITTIIDSMEENGINEYQGADNGWTAIIDGVMMALKHFNNTTADLI